MKSARSFILFIQLTSILFITAFPVSGLADVPLPPVTRQSASIKLSMSVSIGSAKSWMVFVPIGTVNI